MQIKKNLYINIINHQFYFLELIFGELILILL